MRGLCGEEHSPSFFCEAYFTFHRLYHNPIFIHFLFFAGITGGTDLEEGDIIKSSWSGARARGEIR